MRTSAMRLVGTLLIVTSALSCSDDPIGAGLAAGTATALAGDGVVTLSANAPTGGQSPYTYQWHRSTTNGFTPGGSNAMSGFTSLNETDTGATNGTTYYYRLIATDNTGASVAYDQVSATPGAPSTGHSNEPAGMTLVANGDRPFDEEEPAGWGVFGDGGENFQIVADASAPESPSNVGSQRFRDGFVGGSSPANVRNRFGSVQEYTYWYQHYHFKVSDPWQNHDNGVSKVCYLEVIDNTNNARGVAYTALVGPSGLSGQLTFQVRIQTSAYGANYGWNGSGEQSNEVTVTADDAEIVRGQWHSIEVYLIGNTPGQEDGEIHVWLDGTKILQYTSVGIVDTEFNDGATPPTNSEGRMMWGNFSWQPVWGGGNQDTTEQDQYQYHDHIYMSGRN